MRVVSFELVKQNTYELETILTTTNDEMLLVGKMKELVPEFISNNSIFERLDPSLQTKILDMTGGGRNF